MGLAVLVAIPVAILWWPRFRQYPPVTSRESLQLMKLLYAACNTRDPARLARVEEGIAILKQDRKLTPVEEESFLSILSKAKAGAWQEAEQASFRFAEDQVGVGHPTSRHDGHAPKH